MVGIEIDVRGCFMRLADKIQRVSAKLDEAG